MSEVNVTLYTASHRLSGVVALRERLSEALNDPLTSYLEVTRTRVSKLIDPTHATAEWGTVALPKPKIFVATLDLAGHESAFTRQDKAQSKAGVPVAALVGSTEVYGTAHLSSGGNALDVLRNELAVFFPLTEAALLFSATGDSRVDTRLAMVNRHHVGAFTLL